MAEVPHRVGIRASVGDIFAALVEPRYLAGVRDERLGRA